MLGDGKIADGRIDGNKLSATAQADFQGRPLEFAITGKLSGDTMTGTLSAPIVPEPLAFSGSRA